MRRALFWLLTTALLGGQLLAAGQAAANPGRLDPSFGSGGKMTTSFAGDAGASAAVLQNGKLVAAGSATFGTNQDFAIARYHPNGTPHLSFGTGGRATTSQLSA